MIKDFLQERNLPEYRKKQFDKAYYQELLSSFNELTTWPVSLREELQKEIPFSTLKEITSTNSKDKNTTKTLFQTTDGYPLETVLIKYKSGRISICISCMSGCPVKCSFCATGQMGFNRNLSSKEIVDQILYFQRLLKKSNQRITNIVFMGMGEPMLNLKNVEEAIEIMTDDNKLAFSHRRITVSTVGYVPQLKEFLLDHGYTGKLAVSLHAHNQRLREKLMPVVAKNNTLDELFYILDEYIKKRNKRITYEYLLLKDINDSERDAEELSELLRDRLCLVNLIKFNPSSDLHYKASTKDRTENFMKILKDRDINVTLRYSPGEDIKAACGQLASGVRS